MNNFTLITALSVCSFMWISVSVSVEVRSGEEVTLACSNISKHESLTFWFRLVSRTEASCISIIYKANDNPTYCKGFENGKFEVRSNISTISLKIKQVDLSDSGLYLCGFYTKGHPIFTVKDLNVKGADEPYGDLENNREKDSDGTEKLASVILGGLTVFLVMVIIGLVVKIRKLQTADKEEQNPRQRENGSDELTYAAVAFRTEPRRRELETNVIYTATR